MADATNPMWTAEREVGVAVYERVEKLVAANPSSGTSEWVELDYLSHLTESVEEVGGYDGPLTPLLASPPAREEAPACDNCGGKGYTEHEGGDGEGWPSKPEIEACGVCEEAPAEGAGERIDWQAQDAVAGALHSILPLDVDWQHMRIAGRAFVDTLNALRNRTSEPEAGAEAFDPVAFRAKVEAGWDAPPIETRLMGFADWISWCLDGKFDWRTTSPKFLAGMRDDLTIAAHPAPATADKLRVAVEALEAIPKVTGMTPKDVISKQRGIAARTLAALNEQPQ